MSRDDLVPGQDLNIWPKQVCKLKECYEHAKYTVIDLHVGGITVNLFFST